MSIDVYKIVWVPFQMVPVELGLDHFGMHESRQSTSPPTTTPPAIIRTVYRRAIIIAQVTCPAVKAQSQVR